MYRDAERQLKSALRDQEVVDTFLYLCKVYVRLDQPLTGIEVLLKVNVPLVTFSVRLLFSFNFKNDVPVMKTSRECDITLKA